MRALAALALLVLLAGCAQSPAPGQASATQESVSLQPVWDAVDAALGGLPCQASVSGSATESSANLRRLSVLPASGNATLAELDLRGDLAVHAHLAGGGFEVDDIRDPLHVRRVGRFVSPEDALDVKFSPDGQSVLVGTATGIVVADVRDVGNITQVGQWRFGQVPDVASGGPVTSTAAPPRADMLYTARIGAQDWVFVAPNAGTGIWILRLTGTPGQRTLTYVASTLPVEGGARGPTNAFVQKDRLDGHWYLYSADGLHGWTAFNIDDPAKPLYVGGYTDPAQGTFTRSIQVETINGKRIVATSGETGASFLRVYDASQMGLPTLLGTWQADSRTVARGSSVGPSATHPQRDINLVGGNLFLAHYSYGLYVFNLTAYTQGGPSLPLVAGTAPRLLPASAHWAVGTETPSDGPLATDDGYADAVVKDGLVYVSWKRPLGPADGRGGLVVLGYGCHGTRLPEPGLTSTG